MRRFGVTNIKEIEERELSALINECKNMHFKKISEMRHYIIKHNLYYKYRHITGHLIKTNGIIYVKYPATIAPQYREELCNALNLRKKKSALILENFTSYESLAFQKKERLRKLHRIIYEDDMIKEEAEKLEHHHKAWDKIEEIFDKNQNISGYIIYKNKGGFAVKLDFDKISLQAFLPQQNISAETTISINQLMPFKINYFDREIKKITLSHIEALKEIRLEESIKFFQNLHIGMIFEGIVKTIVDYGVFIDLGTIDGLLHIQYVTFKNFHHLSDVFSIGMTISVKVIDFNIEQRKISLSM